MNNFDPDLSVNKKSIMKYSLLAILILGVTPLFAQLSKVTGKVFNSINNRIAVIGF